MKPTITPEVTKKVSDLIKIKLSDAEITKITSQLNTVLAAVDVLNEVDTKKVSTTSQTHGLVNVLEEDKVRQGLDMKKYKNRANFKEGYFRVTKVI